MPYEAVLFDLDGTLIDSLEDLAAATNRTMQHYGFAPHPAEAYKYFVGDGVRKLVTRALPADRQGDQQLIEQCLATYAKDYGSNWNVRTALYPGIAEMLDGLVRRGLRLAILSNKPDPFTQLCVGTFLSAWKFEVIMGARPEFAHKPDPAAALAIARQMNLAPSRFLYLGDTSTDMQTACNAGMEPVGVTWGFRTRDELLSAGARRMVDRPAQILDLLRPSKQDLH